MITTNFLVLLLGLVFLVKGSDYFVKAASTIAKKLGVSEFVIGLTLVAIGTSIPELASSIVASIQQASGIVIGNVVGSNIVNIGLIVGIAAFLSPMKTEVEMLKRDGYIMLFSAVLFFVFALNGELSIIESGIFVLLYIAYVFFLFEEGEIYGGKPYFKEFLKYFVKFKYINSAMQKINGTNHNKNSDSGNGNGNGNGNSRIEGGFGKDIFTLVLSCAAIVIGAKYFVEESIFFAELLGVPDTIIGTTLVAVGTSLPELVVTVSAARKGYGSIALGNIIGSNITNVFLILGLSGLLYPIAVAEISLFFTTPVMIVISLILLVFISTGWEIKRWEGAVMMAFYAAFLVVLFYI
ncbi:sodium:proton exchanger [Methanosarcina sp. 2.H.T.1A.6]|uniref:calcium/sodium antiporter n=1 Tax=unclassified Methanosarcina TaxID=2644672 RepID=UPI00062298CE|nr:MULTISPECIES: calcium/sodium antiporter [unclassified Methanosarcina]KKG15647.1 sodium:proton exchanger [Methanosarcina sp. 2.H.T.1A.3]KKG24660.1 sodium:proton exchanger [Methanosarcina sp. 2.H.T.1A.6]KKG25742.1 sodium:proton exchanger [Methanosarcina sp. 2.H.T.1A.8]KKG29010.1 sodium:proton exchanger [Methanosarcina sp. 2.H.T.1A.15]